MKQTAVEWLEKEIFRNYKFLLQKVDCTRLEESIQQAKEIEKQQQGYSEEEVDRILRNFRTDFLPFGQVNDFTLNNWFEQFKNK